ncbi:MAG: hypothetical protein ABSH33_21360 [Steroidobacteraceae bacterium]|jgi:hypothetical protein
MRLSLVPFLIAGLLAGCATQSSIKPSESLDERTGVTVGALQEPIEFVETFQTPVAGNGKRTSFAYLGPVEWDRSGDITYGLWVHVAPGSDRQVGDIRSQGAVTLILDDGPVVLSPMEAPNVGSGPYKPIASWGQTQYFGLDVAMLKRLAGSEKLSLSFRGVDQSNVDFAPMHETRATLQKFTQARGITDD